MAGRVHRGGNGACAVKAAAPGDAKRHVRAAAPLPRVGVPVTNSIIQPFRVYHVVINVAMAQEAG